MNYCKTCGKETYRPVAFDYCSAKCRENLLSPPILVRSNVRQKDGSIKLTIRKHRKNNKNKRITLQDLIDNLDKPRIKVLSKSNAFIARPEWKALRLQVINHYGANCMRCGSVDNINVDHIRPKSKYPELALDFDNLQVLCWSCNKEKNVHDETDYRTGGNNAAIDRGAI